jgi:enamine deaminase RidA (YjgF/YER057c/UK114 family)
MNVELKIKQLGLKLPTAPRPAGNYSQAMLAGDLLCISGQFSVENGIASYAGRIGAELTPFVSPPFQRTYTRSLSERT